MQIFLVMNLVREGGIANSSTEVKRFASHQLLVTSQQLLVTSYQLLANSYKLLATSYQLLVTSYQLLVTGCSYQSLLTSNQLLVSNYQLLVNSYQLLVEVTSYQLILVSTSQLILSLDRKILSRNFKKNVWWRTLLTNFNSSLKTKEILSLLLILLRIHLFQKQLPKAVL